MSTSGWRFALNGLAEGQAIRELMSIPIVIGAVDERSARACSTLWRHALGVDSIVVDDPRTAEMVKLADNLWIDLNVAMANELAKVCDRLGMDALQVIDAANTMPKGTHNVNILMPSMGVGGYCLTKDPWFVNHLGQVPRVGPGNSADVEDCQRHDARLHLRAAQAAPRRSGQGDRDQQDCGAGHRVQEQHRGLPAHAHQVRRRLARGVRLRAFGP